MKWINVKDETPSKGKFVCLINGKLFFGLVTSYGSFPFVKDYEIYFELRRTLGDLTINGMRWIKPSHFAEVTHWMPLPEIPDEKDVTT